MVMIPQCDNLVALVNHLWPTPGEGTPMTQAGDTYIYMFIMSARAQFEVQLPVTIRLVGITNPNPASNPSPSK